MAGEKFYLRELHRLLKEPIGSLQRQLSLLEKEGVIQSEKVGPLKYFYLNQEYPHFQELKSIILKETRKEKLEKNLRKLLRVLKEKYKPEKVILFGSLGCGKIRADSDLDLFIVKKKVPERYWDRVKQLAPFLKDCTVGVDFVIWTPEELEKGKNQLFLNQEILKKGKIVYERTLQRMVV